MKNKETDLFENRELSWLKFNERVLEEAETKHNPLCERMTFLSIFQTNLDEFFMVRVGTLEDQKLLEEEIRDNKTNMSAQEQINAILQRVQELNKRKEVIYEELMQSVSAYGIAIKDIKSLGKTTQKRLEEYFIHEIIPLLSVMVVGRKQPFPFLKGKEIYAVAQITEKGAKDKLGIIPCTSTVIPRLIPVPGKKGTYVLSEELILHFMPKAFKGYKIIEKTLLRVTRNADIDMHAAYDEELNYRDQMVRIVKLRKKLAPVRLEMTRKISDKLLDRLCLYCDACKEHTFLTSTPLDFSFIFQIEDILRKEEGLVYSKRLPQPSPDINMDHPIIPQILKKDILLSYPYESIRPFLHMLQEAARDPKVISIRMTLYRLAKNSKVVEALVEAAERGKQVDVLVELKARFDEENNIEWSRLLEDAGCHVVYGIDELKVHSKLCLITRKDGDDIQYITQVGTGNYNEKTSRLYTDLSYMTSRRDIGENVASVFQAILLGEVLEESGPLLVAPKCLQKPILDKIDHEIKLAKEGKDTYIGIKINSLTDKAIIDKLIEASQAGVHIDMIIRGICCLRSQIPEKTDHINIRSVVGRFLEHSRIYIFGTPDRDEIYIASADFMTRNTLRRVEVAAPIEAPDLKDRIREIFRAFLKDNVKARVQQADGSYTIPESTEEPFNVQEWQYEQAYKNASGELSEK